MISFRNKDRVSVLDLRGWYEVEEFEYNGEYIEQVEISKDRVELHAYCTDYEDWEYAGTLFKDNKYDLQVIKEIIVRGRL